MLSAYEEQRDRNIAANHEKLEQLGLLSKTPASATTQPRKRKERPIATDAVRKSSRSRPSDDSAAPPSPSRQRPADIPPWEATLFRELEKKGASSSRGAKWDARKHHQHLTRSPDGSAVATTGVAGYGAALACSVSGCSRLAVRAVRFGVGGFGVGIVRKAGLKAPFKSLGRMAGSVGVYLCDGTFVTPELGARSFGPPYAEGDLVEVLLRPSKAAGGGAKTKPKPGARTDVVYFVNGQEVGVAAIVDAPADGLLLAVQPYMGGVAQLRN